MPSQPIPAPVKKRYSNSSTDLRGNKPVTLVNSTTAQSPKMRKRALKRTSEESTIDIVDPDMATDFQQFCSVCDRQIALPNSSLLYCSESCRVRDSITSMPSSSRSQIPVSLPKASHNAIYEDTHQCVNIMPQRSPTLQKPPLPRFQIDMDYAASKAEIGEGLPSQEGRASRHRSTDSEAALYLRQFQSGQRRPHSRRTSVSSRVPSLSHTPASSTSLPTSSYESQDESLTLCRHARVGSLGINGTAELMRPLSYCPTAPASIETLTTADEDVNENKWSLKSPPAATKVTIGMPEFEAVSYEKKAIANRTYGTSSERSSIRQLFEFDAIRGRNES